MIALVTSELVRLVARRLLRVLLGLVVVGTALAGVLTFVNTAATTQADLARSSAASQARYQACLQDPPDVFGPGGRVDSLPPDMLAQLCRDQARVRDERFRTQDLPDILKGTTAPLVILVTVLGASSIGADWPTRSITTLLTWEPRRVRVLLAKALAVAVVGIGLYLLGQALVVAALGPAMAAHGTGLTGDGFASDLAGTLARGCLLTAVMATLGFAGAALGRSTTAVLGTAFGYVVVVENVVGSFLAGWRQWLLLGNAIVFVSGQDGAGDVLDRSVIAAGVYLVVLAAGLLAAAVLVVRQRDIG